MAGKKRSQEPISHAGSVNSGRHSIIKEIRIYAEVIEQGIYFNRHLEMVKERNPEMQFGINIIFVKRIPEKFAKESLVAYLKVLKSYDLVLSAVISEENGQLREVPILNVEFTAAVPDDEHIWQKYDGIFWSLDFSIPFMKISSLKKKSQAGKAGFGGSTEITPEDEMYIIQQNGGSLFMINWDTLENSEFLQTGDGYYSCPPESPALRSFLENLCKLLQTISHARDFFSFSKELQTVKKPDSFDTLLSRLISRRPEKNRLDEKMKRFYFRFYRYGHALDPDKGGVILFSLLTKARDKSISMITDFPVHRERLEGRLSYKTLYDVAKNRKAILMEKAAALIANQNNLMTPETALSFFKIATTSESLFEDCTIRDDRIIIADDKLNSFMEESSNDADKILLYQSKEFIFSDSNGDQIAEVHWNNKIAEDYYANKKSAMTNAGLDPLPIHPLSSKSNLDLETLCCIRVLVDLGYIIVAVSFPNAQGDRRILIGSGKQAERRYVNIIAVKGNSILLFECNPDIEKKESMEEIAKEFKQNLLDLVNIILKKPLRDPRVQLGIGGFTKPKLPGAFSLRISLGDIDNRTTSIHIAWEAFISENTITEQVKKETGDIELKYSIYQIQSD